MTTKRFSLFAIVMAAFVLLLGCKKEKPIENYAYKDIKASSITENDSIPSIIYGIDIDLPINKQDVSKLLLKPDDPDGEKINYQLYYLSLSIQELVKSSIFNRDVIEIAKSSCNQTADLNELFLFHPEYKNIIDKKLEDYHTSFQEIFDNMTRICPERKTFEKYKPVIFIPNLDNIDINKQPIFSPNIEVDCTEDEAIEDCIVAWYYNEYGEKVEVMLSEQNSLELTNPLFLLDNGELYPKPSPRMNDKNNDQYEDNKAISTTTSYYIKEFNLYHYFETIGKPEFTIVAYRIDHNINPNEIYRMYYGGNEVDGHSKILRKVDRNEICTQVEHWCYLFPKCTSETQNIIVFNTYERDWNRSEKRLGHLSGGDNNTNHIYLNGRMQYDSDWYGINPNNFAWSDSFDQEYVYNHWAKWYYFTNSCMRAWRVDI